MIKINLVFKEFSMNVKISVLVDDRVTKSSFIGEHGLSIYINVDGYEVLFDTGQGMALKHNADILGIKLAQIKTLVLSHGHYDHTGGIKFFNPNDLTVYAHPDIFKPRFKKIKKGEYKNIGFDRTQDKFDKINWVLDQNPVSLSDNVFISGKVDRITGFEESTEPFYIINSQNRYEKDPIDDDQSLFIKTKLGTVIITGCAHSGLVNIINKAKSVINDDRVYCILGGTHLIKASKDRLRLTADYLKKIKLKNFYAGHCTDFNAACYLKNELNGIFCPLETGMELSLDF